MLVLLSAVLYATYTVCIRRTLTDDDHVSAGLGWDCRMSTSIACL